VGHLGFYSSGYTRPKLSVRPIQASLAKSHSSRIVGGKKKKSWG
jgi:hypothetical protein